MLQLLELWLKCQQLESLSALAPSTKTILKDHGHYGFEEYNGHNMHFGVREHAMGAIANGMALHGGTISVHLYS